MIKKISPEISEKTKVLDGKALKMIAAVTMLIDHIGAAIVGPYVSSVQMSSGQAASLEVLYNVLRAIGRTSFPIFCFMLVEGFYYTRSRAKYLSKIMIFAVISEYPFDMAIYGRPYNGHQDVLFTFAIGLITIWSIEAVCCDIMKRARKNEEYEQKLRDGGITGESTQWGHKTVREIDLEPEMVISHEKKKPKARQTLREQHSGYGIVWAGFFQVMASMGIMIAGCLLAYYLKVDYGFSGIVLIFFLYILHNERLFAALAGYADMCWEPWSFPAFVLMQFYNGKRGKQHKYFFYVFYPAHLIVLAIIRYIAVGIR